MLRHARHIFPPLSIQYTRTHFLNEIDLQGHLVQLAFVVGKQHQYALSLSLVVLSALSLHHIGISMGKAVKVASKTSSNNCSQVFGKLDPAQFQRRIEQRRRAIQHGKNTAGYDEYVKQVPKNQRRPRSMKHPSTPDYTLEIPTKRWQGLVKAW